jgi:hypothetical protein
MGYLDMSELIESDSHYVSWVVSRGGQGVTRSREVYHHP